MSVYKKWTLMKQFNKNKIEKMGPEQGKNVVFKLKLKRPLMSVIKDIFNVGSKPTLKVFNNIIKDVGL